MKVSANSRTLRGAMLLLVIFTLLGASACQGSSRGTTDSNGASVLDRVQKNKVLRVGIRPDHAPHSSINQQGEWVGFDIDIARGIANQINVRLEIVSVNELTRISFTKDGKIDAAITSISKTWDRAREVAFSETYFWSYQTFIVKKGGGITSLRDLVGKKIAADRGGNADDNWLAWLKRNGLEGQAQVVEFGDKQAAVAAVRNGAVSAYALDYEALVKYAKVNPDLEILTKEGGFGPKYDGVVVRQNDTKILNAVNFALQEIETSGEYERVYNKWFGPDTDIPLPQQGHITVWPRNG
jgi:polar amino acid transport system substrate-binding protein